ncbi:MAG: hypothetical protein NZL85_03930 [Fimbriimonadales bacterium]|nr:hypothetical protein [Fimbriimonadales bacterium]
MSRFLTRFWAHLTLTPHRLQRLQMAAISSAVACVLLLGIGFTQLNRVRQETESYRAEVLAPPAQPELPIEEQQLLEAVQKIAAQLSSTPNAQAFAISRLSQIAQQQGLTVTGVETSEPPGASSLPNTSGEWNARLLRFRLSGSSQQIVRWLQSLEAVPLVIKPTGVQVSADSGGSKGVSAVIEMEILLPPAQGGPGR